MKARLHPHWAGGRAGYLYSVIYDGELMRSGRSVGKSRPDCESVWGADIALNYSVSDLLCVVQDHRGNSP